MEWCGTMLFVEGRCVASIHKNFNKGWYALHHTWVYKHMKPISTPCKTHEGIKRRVERYAQVWVLAGKPDGDE
jgi:hypothetical protein